MRIVSNPPAQPESYERDLEFAILGLWSTKVKIYTKLYAQYSKFNYVCVCVCRLSSTGKMKNRAVGDSFRFRERYYKMIESQKSKSS